MFGEKVTSNFGEHLRREREMRGVSLDEISAATRISTRFLLALENEQWEHLPGGVFNRGFIRSVSRYLGLDEEAFLAEYALVTKDKPQVALVADGPAQSRHSIVPWLVLVAAVGLVAAGWLAWQHYAPMIHVYRNPAPSPPAVVRPVPADEAKAVLNSAEGTAPSSATAPEKLLLKVDVGQATTVKVIADGKVVFQGRMTPGGGKTFEARDTFEISAANARTVVLEMNGQLMPAMGMEETSASIKLDRTNLKKSDGGAH